MNLHLPPQLQPFSSNKDHSLNPGNRAARGWGTDSTFTPRLLPRESCSSSGPPLGACEQNPLHVCVEKRILHHPQKTALSIEIFQQCSFLETTTKTLGCRIFILYIPRCTKRGAECFSGSRISSHEQWFRRVRISVFKNVSFGKLCDLLETPLIYFLCFDYSASMYI